MRFIKLTFFLFALVLQAACIDDNLRKIMDGKVKVALDPDIAAPVGQFNITIANLLRNDSLVLQDTTNGSLKIVYRDDSLIRQEVSDILNIPNQPSTSTKAKVGKLNIDGFNIQRSLSIDSVLRNLDSITRSALSVASSLGIPTPFPEIPLQGGGYHSLGSVSTFSNAFFDAGTLQFNMTNNWNATIQTLVIDLQNPGNQSVGKIRFVNVAPNTSQSAQIDLSGKILFSNLSFVIDSIYVPTSTQPVTVSLGQTIQLSVSGTGLRINTAIAQIPGQNLGNDTSTVAFDMDDGEELYEVFLDSGSLDLRFNSSLHLAIACSLQIPGIRDLAGQSVIRGFVIQSGPQGNLIIDLSNKIIDLKLLSQGFNQLQVLFTKAILPSSGNISIDQNDSIEFTYALKNLKFNHVKGYFGQKDIGSSPAAVDLNLSTLKDLGGTFFLANPELKLKVQNSIGAPLNLDLNLSGRKAGQSPVFLNSPNRAIPHPTVLGTTATGQISYNRNNSSLPQLISMPPDSILAAGDIRLNPLGVTDTNFITKNSFIQLGVEMEMPFELSASGVGFGDTLEFDGAVFESLKAATLVFKTINGFPFDFNARFTFMDSTYAPLFSDSLSIMESALINADGEVIETKSNISRLSMNESNLIPVRRAKYLVARLTMQTPQNGTRVVKLYSDYSIILKVGL
ncbi:MAG: hypothetical protein FJ351_01435, partial [Sphingomonadales bacterium]|nr:hypothetical protein [Sphingomonadales bacterium]